MMMNEVILVDAYDRLIGVEEKQAAHYSDSLHRAFSVFIYDRAGRMLLQQRGVRSRTGPDGVRRRRRGGRASQLHSLWAVESGVVARCRARNAVRTPDEDPAKW